MAELADTLQGIVAEVVQQLKDNDKQLQVSTSAHFLLNLNVFWFF